MLENQQYVAPRTCKVVHEGEQQRDGDTEKALNDFGNRAAYVLIAEPGAGKTTAFTNEAASQEGIFVTVRQFLTFDRPEWQDKTLFLDGLDESRAGLVDGRSPLDQIRKKLCDLGCPQFRLSCRWGDWLAISDREGLKEVSPDGEVTVIRLNPLTKVNIKDILVKNHGVTDPDDFIANAKERGVEPLLSNPQNLDLIAKLVKDGKWPDSKRETFGRACRMLVQEKNGEHLDANPPTTNPDSLLDVAGRLFAVQLLAGHAGYTVPGRAEPDSDYPSLIEAGGDLQGLARDVLGTRLFTGISEGKLAPVHRQIAEYLAARYVSRLLDDGLPLARVLALITGFDGELMTRFGNFVSWLAVHNKASRKPLSRLDPTGLIYISDQVEYSLEEKREVVLNLRREWMENPRCYRHIGRVTGIGSIVSPELESTFREILSDERRCVEQQSYVNDVLQMLADGEPLAGLVESLEEIVGDVSQYHGVRCRALVALIVYNEQGCCDSRKLVAIFNKIVEGSISDLDDELLGILLKALYPKVLPMTEVKKCLREPRLKDRTGEYSDFWVDHFPKESTTEQLCELLDHITEKYEDYRTMFLGEVGNNTRMAQLPVELLDQVFSPFHGDLLNGDVDIIRLHDWLGVISDSGVRVADWKLSSLRSRLEWKENVLKDLISYALGKCIENGEDCSILIDRRLLGARPRRYAPWCLEMALSGECPTTASFYLRELFECLIDDHRTDRLTIEDARNALKENEVLLQQFNQWLETSTKAKQLKKKDTIPRWTGAEDKNVPGIEQNKSGVTVMKGFDANPNYIHQAAEVYLGFHERYKGRAPLDRLHEFTCNNLDQAKSLLEQMEGVIARGNLPDCDQVVRTLDQGKVNTLVLPFAVGLHSLEGNNQLTIRELDKSVIRLAITMIYTLPRQCLDPENGDRPGIPRPAWFQELLKDDPALVADVLCRTTHLKLETGKQPAFELQELVNSEDHSYIAEKVSLQILQEFPNAETEVALMSLCWALRAALANSDWSELEIIVEKRLQQGELSEPERGLWVFAGFLVAPDVYREELPSLAADEEKFKWLVRFASVEGSRSKLAQCLSAIDIGSLTELLARASRYDSIPQNAYWWITDLIMALVDDSSTGAAETLEMLSQVPDAEFWSPEIAYAKNSKARKRREAEFRHSKIQEVVGTLQNGSPANPGDLAALVLDKLTGLSEKIRDGSTSDWHQYWNVDRYNRAQRPKPEEACRDTLLSDLEFLLSGTGVEAVKEGSYADDKRADIKIIFDGFNVPVEIKRSCHDDLWVAIRDQLIEKYTRDPGAEGFGLYVVFWFGDTEKCPPTRHDGSIPGSASDVRAILEQSLSDSERNLISIFVVDVSAPQ